MNAVLDIVALRSLASIADSGGFRRAAESLHLSQSAISAHVRRLEIACGCALFERDGRGSRFTEEGELLVAEARKILAAHDDALGRLRGIDSAERTLVIGSTEHGADVLLPAITTRLRVDFPGRALRFRIDRGSALNERMDQGSVDAAVLLGAGSGPDVRAAGALPLRWYAAPGWSRPRSPRAPVPLVVIDGPCTIRRRALEALAAHGVTSTVVCEAGHLAGVLHAVRAGMGVALLADRGAASEGIAARSDLPAVAPEPLHVRGRRGAAAGLLGAVAQAVSAAV